MKTTLIAFALVVIPSTVPAQQVIASRATAITLKLSSNASVQTQGYTTPGDGGGATFVKIAGGTFKDTYVTAGTITAGTGYTDSTYLGVPMVGGTSQGCKARVTIVSGGMTAVDLTGGYCAGYALGDTLTPDTATVKVGAGAKFVVTSITSPTASFIDSDNTRWQFVVDAEAFPNVRQFGAMLDWNGVDSTATNDLVSFRSAMAFMSSEFGAANAHVNGGTLLVPKGAAYLCAGNAPFTTLQVPHGVIVRGAGVFGGTTLWQCAAENASTHFITLCDPNAQSGQFGCRLEDVAVMSLGAASTNIANVYSNSGQQFQLLNNVYIQASRRSCVVYEIGKGGAANAIFENINCEQTDSATTNPGLLGYSSGTQIILRNAVFGCAKLCRNAYAINIVRGNLIVDGVHVEGYMNAVNLQTTMTQHLSVLRNMTLTNGCVNGITLRSTNPNNTVLVENIESSCSTATVLNGHSGGSAVTGHIMTQRVFNP